MTLHASRSFLGCAIMRTVSHNPFIFNAYNFSGIRYKKSIGQILSAILDSDLGQEDYAKT